MTDKIPVDQYNPLFDEISHGKFKTLNELRELLSVKFGKHGLNPNKNGFQTRVAIRLCISRPIFNMLLNGKRTITKSRIQHLVDILNAE